MRLRSSMFAHIQRLDIRYIDRRGVGSIMSRLQNDVSVIDQLFADGLVDILSQMALLVGIIVLMWVTNWKLALVAFALLPIGRLDAQSDSGFAAWAGARAIPIDSSARALRAR